jgi:hypothetical protein
MSYTGTVKKALVDVSGEALIWATTEAMDCVAGDECTKGRPGDIGAPKFLRIDFSKKVIYGPKRSTSIVAMDTSDKQILFKERKWSLAGCWRWTRKAGP